MGQTSGKQSKASKHSYTKLMRCPVITPDINKDIFSPRISSTGTCSLCILGIIHSFNTGNTLTPKCISTDFFYICQIIILPARSPRSAPLLVPPVIYARLIGFVPVSSPLSIVLSRISDALPPYLEPGDSPHHTAPIVVSLSNTHP